jgi:hypothetical protein
VACVRVTVWEGWKDWAYPVVLLTVKEPVSVNVSREATLISDPTLHTAASAGGSVDQE